MIKLDQLGSNLIRLDQIGLDWIKLDQVGSNCQNLGVGACPPPLPYPLSLIIEKLGLSLYCLKIFKLVFSNLNSKNEINKEFWFLVFGHQLSLRPKFGFVIGNRNQGSILVSVSEPKFFFPKPKLFIFKFFSFFPTSLGNISFHRLRNKPRS